MPPKKKQKTPAWKPLTTDEKHRPEQPGKLSERFPKQYIETIENSDNRSFWKFAFHLQEMVYLYKVLGDYSRTGTFQKALDNMLDLSNHNYEDHNKDKFENYIGIGHEDMGTDMVKDDVKCLRDITGVGASTVKLIEEWIETGTMKRLENLRKEATPSITERVRYTLNGEEFETKHDYIPDFLKALGELAELYEKEDDFRATAMRRAIIALEGQIISAVEDIKLFVLGDLKGVGKGTLGMLEEFIQTGKIERLEEFQPKTTKEDWDAFIKYHEPLRQYFLGEELLLNFEEYKVVITCGYHQRDLDSQLTQIIENDPDEYPDEQTRKTLRHPPVYDIEKLKRSIDKYDFRLGCAHEEYIFEGYVKHGDIKTHPFVISFEHDDYRNPLFKALGWTPGGLEDFLWKQLWEKGSDSWVKILEETKAEKTGIPFTFEHDGKKYKVKGTVEEYEYEGTIRHLQFDGNLFLRDEKIATVDLLYEPDQFESEGNHCYISYVGKEDEEEEEEEDPVKELIEQAFYQNVVSHHNMAYRE